jgi:hypothetical protein
LRFVRTEGDLGLYMDGYVPAIPVADFVVVVTIHEILALRFLVRRVHDSSRSC